MKGFIIKNTRALAGGIALSASLLAASPARAASIAAPFASTYSLVDLGTPGNLNADGNLGALGFLDDNHLLFAWNATDPHPTFALDGGAVFSIAVTRDAAGHITGFSGDPVFLTNAPSIDAGVAFGPGPGGGLPDLYFTGYGKNVNSLNEVMPGDTSPDKTIGLTALGVKITTGGLAFAPDGSLKVTSYGDATTSGPGGFYSLGLTPDGSGTYDVSSVTEEAQFTDGAEGFLYVPLGSPLFGAGGLLIAKNTTGEVDFYSFVSGTFNPLVSSVQAFITGLDGAEGAVLDPVTNDFLFGTYDDGNHIVLVSANEVPEPASLLLIGTGLFGIATWRRCRNRARS